LISLGGVGEPAEHDLDGGGVPHRPGLLVSPAGAGLGEGLQHGQGGQAGAAAVGQQRRQGGQRGDVRGLVEHQRQRRVQPPAWRACGAAAGGFDDVLD